MSKLGDYVKQKRMVLGWGQDDLAERLGVNQSTVSSVESGQTTSPRGWQKYAELLSIPEDEFRELMFESVKAAERKRLPAVMRSSSSITAAPAPTMPNRDVPVYGRARGGDDGMYLFNGDVIGWESRPPQLEGVPDAYATYVDGESMYPRYKAGETVWLNPHKPAGRGDDVVVQLRPNEEFDAPHGFIKEYVRKTPTKLVVCQHNPQREIEYDLGDVVSIHPIVFAQRG
jgi:phage repressor protein C with HTH and peptisase S24 domain/DNA-binding XRE family transcriptional regulator